MSAITGIGERSTIVFSATASSSRGTAHADQVGARLGDLVDLLHRRLEVGGLGLGHRLHGDRGAAADRHAADEDLALRCHADIVTAGEGPAAIGTGPAVEIGNTAPRCRGRASRRPCLLRPLDAADLAPAFELMAPDVESHRAEQPQRW